MQSLYFEKNYITWSESDPLLDRLTPVSDVYSMSIDVHNGIVYGRALELPIEVLRGNLSQDDWLLQQAELDDRVVANGSVLPIIGSCPVRLGAAYRYYAAWYRSRISNEQEFLRLAQTIGSKSVRADVYISAGEIARSVSIDVPLDADQHDVALALLERLAATLDIERSDISRALVSVAKWRLDHCGQFVSKVSTLGETLQFVCNKNETT